MKEWIAKIKREVQPPSPIGVSNRVILKLIAEIEKLEKEKDIKEHVIQNCESDLRKREKEIKQLKWEMQEMIKRQTTPERIKQSILELRQTFKDWEQKHDKIQQLENIKEKAKAFMKAEDEFGNAGVPFGIRWANKMNAKQELRQAIAESEEK